MVHPWTMIQLAYWIHTALIGPTGEPLSGLHCTNKEANNAATKEPPFVREEDKTKPRDRVDAANGTQCRYAPVKQNL